MWSSWETRCGIASYTAALVDQLRALGADVEVTPVPYTDRDPVRMAETIARLNAADLIHVQHEYTFFGGIAPGSSSLPRYYAGLTVPRVVTAHTVFTAAELLRVKHETRWRQLLAKQLLSRYPPYRATVEAQPFRGATAVVVHTDAARARMASRGIELERIHVLPAGVPPPVPALPEQVEAMRATFGLAGRRVATIFGYVTQDKGYETTLEALRKLPPTVKLLVAGGSRVEREQGYLEQLREVVRAQKLTERVAITGYLDDAEIAAAMALSDVVLVPHLVANGSYSVMVALGYGKPVLASDLACFRDIHQQGEPIELFKVGDEYALAGRLGFLLASANARKHLAAAAQEFAAAQSWRAVAERTLTVYEQVLSRAHK
ncbi:MAG: glycosyltransferase family 4 protein [Actinomycetota bacterium]